MPVNLFTDGFDKQLRACCYAEINLPKLSCDHTADCKQAKPSAMLTRLLRDQKKKNKKSVLFSWICFSKC